MPPTDEHGPVIPLSQFWRVFISLALLFLAAAHVLLPHVDLDAIFLGLLGAALAVVFFDVDSFEWHGIRARRIRRQIEEAEEVVKAVEVPLQLPGPLKPPIPTGGSGESIGYQGIIHREPLDLMPPTEPLERLLWGAEQIRVELIVLAGNLGALKDRATWDRYNGKQLARMLQTDKRVPPDLTSSIERALDVRNRVVHTKHRLDRGLVDAASDLAMDVLIKLRSIKREYHRVRDPDVAIYKDQSLSTLHETAGVAIVQLDDQGKTLHIGIYPRVRQYVKGHFVSWEWDMNRAFKEEGWYLDPVKNRAKLAWSKSATFAGREYPRQWGLEYYFSRPDVGLE